MDTSTKPVSTQAIPPRQCNPPTPSSVIPYTNVFLEGAPKPNHVVLKAEVTSLRPGSITISDTFPELGVPSTEIPFDYAVYALGATMPSPLDLWGTDPRDTGNMEAHDAAQWEFHGTKANSIEWLKERQKVIQSPSSVLVVGGGALGIRASPLTVRLPNTS